ncbi:MAG: hypothetical protein ACT4ON_09130 [Bacteroidota bacterium]
MKKVLNIRFYFLVMMGLLTSAPNSLIAQKKLGESVITVGAGYSILGIASSINVNNDTNSLLHDNFVANPFLVGSYDIGLAEIVSLGLSYSYQSFRYTYDGYSRSRNNAKVRFTDKFTRTNYGLRLLFHFGKKETVDMYSGIRLGYTVWGISTDNDQYSDYKPEDAKGAVPWALRVNIKNTHYTGQAIFGIRYFFTKNLGFNWEIGIGPPGLFMLGLNLKF